MITAKSRLLCLTGALLALSHLALADPPRKPSVSQFSRLINESPFTIKPAPIERAPVATPLERDWMLGSIRPHENGYAVTLINKKDRKDRIRFVPGFSSGDYKLLDVEQDLENSMNSRVQVSKGSVTAWLTYDEKLIQIRPAVAAAKSPSKGSTTAPSTNPSRSKTPIPGKPSATRQSRSRTR